MTGRSPRIEKWREQAGLGADHTAFDLSPDDAIAPALEYFLGVEEFVQGVFASASPINSRAFSVDDPALAGLQGVILFSKYDNFSIVNRATADQALLR